MKKTITILALIALSAAAQAGNRGPALSLAVHPDSHKVRCYSLHCGPDHPPGTHQPGSYYGPDGTQYLTGRVPVDRSPCARTGTCQPIIGAESSPAVGPAFAPPLVPQQ